MFKMKNKLADMAAACKARETQLAMDGRMDESIHVRIERNVYEVNGVRMVDVPDELLRHGCSLTAYACKCEGDEREVTQIREEFKVISRKRPYNEQGETA